MTDDPSELAAAASRGEAPGPESGEEPADGPPGSEGSAGTSRALPDEDVSLFDALMHTEPALSPEDMDDLPPWAADLVIGSVKVMHAYGIEAGGDAGTPAAVNLARGSVGGYRAMQDRRADEDEGGEPGEVETA
jgi:hypothetical protein